MTLDLRFEKLKVCYICGSNRCIDDHHLDCMEGKLNPETVPLCRRCHRTYHDLGVEWFDDEYLDKAIEIENRHREIIYASLENPVAPLELLKREDIKRTSYFNKKHGIKDSRNNRDTIAPALPFRLPHGEPLCGWDWVHAHTLLTFTDI